MALNINNQALKRCNFNGNKVKTIRVNGQIVWTNDLTLDDFSYTGAYEKINDGNGTYRIKLKSNGTLTLANDGDVEVFMVGGGGAGGSRKSSEGNTGTGGNGGSVTISTVSLTANTPYNITIGIGGTGIYSGTGTSGSATTGFGLTAAGGAGGSHAYSNTATGSNCLEFNGDNAVDTSTYYSKPGGRSNGGASDANPRNTNTGSGGFGSGNKSYANYSQGGDSGIVIIRKKISIIPIDFIYSGEAEQIDDGNGNWRLKLRSSGTLTMRSSVDAEAFLVGGGGGGGSRKSSEDNYGRGGHGGAVTIGDISLVNGSSYSITIGSGGSGTYDGSGTAGGATTGFGLTAAGGSGGSHAYSDTSTGVNCLEFKGINATDTSTYYSKPAGRSQGGAADVYPRTGNTGDAGFGSGNSSYANYSQGGVNGVIIIRNKRS